MRTSHYLALAVMVAALPSICAAADPPRHAFECDTPAGHFSYWNRTVDGGAIEVAGKLKVNELLEDKKWSPGAYVMLYGSGERAPRYGIRVFAVMKTPDLLFLELRKVGGHDAIGLGSIPHTKKPIPFTLQLDSAGTLKVSVAGSDASAALGDFKPATLELGCSTGDFEFTDVTVSEKPGP